jgi:V-type H+-transporting ATPase proteolipid subunit
MGSTFTSVPAKAFYTIIGIVLLVIILNLLFTGNGEQFNVGRYLVQTSPFLWAALGCGLCVGISVIGAGWYVCSLES